MEFLLNGITYRIKEISQKEYKEMRKQQDEQKGIEIEDLSKGVYQGATHSDECIIYLDESLKQDRQRKTLIHELTHAYIVEYISHIDKQYSEEEVADLVSNCLDIIVPIINDYYQSFKISL